MLGEFTGTRQGFQKWPAFFLPSSDGALSSCSSQCTPHAPIFINHVLLLQQMTQAEREGVKMGPLAADPHCLLAPPDVIRVKAPLEMLIEDVWWGLSNSLPLLMAG